MANGSDPGFTVKEILTNFIQPTLENIEKKLDAKADASDLKKVEDHLDKVENRVELIATATAELPGVITKVNDLENKLSTPEQIAGMIATGLQENKARGWTTRERLLGGAVALMTLITLVINLLTSH